jgi:hypothetical protein
MNNVNKDTFIGCILIRQRQVKDKTLNSTFIFVSYRLLIEVVGILTAVNRLPKIRADF